MTVFTWEGTTLGAMVGAAAGGCVGALVGATVGDTFGVDVGALLGATVGDAIGDDDGALLGATVGDAIGDEGALLGALVGEDEGFGVGDGGACGSFLCDVTGNSASPEERLGAARVFGMVPPPEQDASAQAKSKVPAVRNTGLQSVVRDIKKKPLG